MSTDNLPKFDAPPVIETATSVQFSRLSGFSAPLVGWFWKSYLAEAKWEKSAETARLQDAFEKFGDEEMWGRWQLRFGQIETNRVQLIEAGEERMIQVQDSRFILNWRKKSGPYPSFARLSEQFWQIFPRFEKFASDAGVGPIEQNQWEVTYVNDIPKGELWKTTADWSNVFPDLKLPHGVTGLLAAPDPISLDWRLNFADERGRLYINLQHAKNDGVPASDSFMRLSFTARGPIDKEKGWNLSNGLELGHQAIVRTFAEMTSENAHRVWKRSSK